MALSLETGAPQQKEITQLKTSNGRQPYPGCRTCIRQAFIIKKVPECAINTSLQSLSEGTLKQYNGTFKLWWDFCCEKSYPVFESGVQQVLEFLQYLLNSQEIRYGTFNSHRSALSLILKEPIGEDPRIKRFLKGIYNIRPTAPKYNRVWDTQPLISYLEKLFPNEQLTLRLISIKLATLIVLITGHRIQTVHAIKTDNIVASSHGYEIFIPDKIKSSSLNKAQPCLQVPFYRERPSLCVGSILRLYLQQTQNLRKENLENLFLTSKPPFKCASKQTVSNWVKFALKNAGIDTSKFGPHSMRHASTSTAFKKGVSIETIRQTAGWSETSQTFFRFYNRPTEDPTIFAKCLLDK